MEKLNYRNRVWWGFLDGDIKELVSEAALLYEISAKIPEKFDDYSFVVFPAAKAYEGYLKKAFFKLGFITNDDYAGKHFRIGKALNPSLEKKFRRESVYDRIVGYSGNVQLADELWNAWKTGRNLLFHWFPDERNAISYTEAGERLNMIFDAMENFYKKCKLDGH